MADERYAFDEDGARRIVETVRRSEARPGNLRREGPMPMQGPRSFWMCQTTSTAYVAQGATGTFTAYSGTAGSETATSFTAIKGYVQKGCCLPSVMYFLVEINGIFYVWNPTMLVRGQVGSDITTGNSGTLTIYTGANGSEASISQTISNVKNASSCTVKANLMTAAYYVEDNNTWLFENAYTS